MRLHVVSLPHTETTAKYLHCAYTQKVVKFCKMMLAEGHEVFLYAGEHNDAPCTEHIVCVTEEERIKWFGEWDKNTLFTNIDWQPDSPHFAVMNARAIHYINERRLPGDFLCAVMGWSQHSIHEAIPQLMPCEWAVGYEGISMPFRAFESYAWMHHLYGLQAGKGWKPELINGQAFDAVIPNFFDPDDFHAPNDPKRPERKNHVLFLGRVTMRKGPHVAADIAARAKRRLWVAGPGVISHERNHILSPEIDIRGPVKYIGVLNLAQRKKALAEAAAIIVPTQYIEPFGGVAVEAMMSGTPVVATDWGAFTETVVPGVTGERFHIIREGVEALERAVEIPPQTIYDHAMKHYSLDAVGPQFTEWFERLSTLWGKGYYAD